MMLKKYLSEAQQHTFVTLVQVGKHVTAVTETVCPAVLQTDCLSHGIVNRLLDPRYCRPFVGPAVL